MKTITKRFLVICGFLSVGLGIAGMFLPLLPTTPFLLLAAVCFAKSSKKAHAWLLTNRWCGEYIRNYQENKGIALRHKIISLSLLWVTIGYSIFFIVHYLWLKALLFAIAVGVTVHILRMKTCETKFDKKEDSDSIALNNIETYKT